MRAWDRWRDAAADLVVGAACAGCSAPGPLWCAACAEACRPRPHLVEVIRSSAAVPVVAAVANTGPMARAIVAWKDRGRHRLTGPLAHLLACSCVPFCDGPGPVGLVPMPADRRQVRRRGADVAADLAVHAARRLMAVGVEAEALAVLRRTRATRDQAGLSARQRRANVDGAFAADSRALQRWRARGESTLLVVDDIVTTGASAAEAARALAAAHGHVAGIAVVASTPRASGFPNAR
ncbi:MAG: ComF family protein [Aeromicrobium sp.]|uniref:ComF family protein n=1 Tax=Aeromicrobium sp. TaxID=1871063 RepID=UPI0039E23244